MKYPSLKSCHGIVLILAILSPATSFSLVKRSLFSIAQTDGHKLFFQDITPPSDMEKRVGETIVLECEAGGSPSPTIHWLFQGIRIETGKESIAMDDVASYEDSLTNRNMKTLRLGTTKSKYVLECATTADIGAYTCVAETPYQRISHTTKVTIAPAPRRREKLVEQQCIEQRMSNPPKAPVISMWTVQRLEFEGADVQLFCRAHGSPSPRVVWYDRDEQPITVNDPQHTVLSNGDLLIRGVSWLTNMGLYRCRVENDYGSDETTVFLYPTTPQ